jgi:site-specific recombinase XerD
MRWSEATTKYLGWMTAFHGASGDTVTTYAIAFDQIAKHFPEDHIKHFTPATISRYCESLAERRVRASTIRNRLVACASFAKWALRQPHGKGYLLAEDPMLRVERPRATPLRSRLLPLSDLQALRVAATRDHERLALDLFVDSGLRVGEVARANVCDLVERNLRVRLKGGRDRVIPLGEEIARRLHASVDARNAKSTSPLLVNSEGQRWGRSSLSEMVARLGRRAGLARRCGPHMIRHTFNAVADQVAGLSVTVRAALLNHAGTGSLQKYDHLLAHDTTAARDAVREAFRRVTADVPVKGISEGARAASP